MAKRIVFTGGSGKAGKHAVPWLKAKGYDILNLDLKPLDCPGVNTLITDVCDSGQVFNALTMHYGFDGYDKGQVPQAPDAVVHFAAIPRVLIEPEQDLRSQRHVDIQRHRGGDEARHPQGDHRLQRDHLWRMLRRGR